MSKDHLSKTDGNAVLQQKEAPKVDLKKLIGLMDDRKKYQVSTVLYRFMFSFLCGIWFHYLYMQRNIFLVTMPSFIVLLQLFY